MPVNVFRPYRFRHWERQSEKGRARGRVSRVGFVVQLVHMADPLARIFEAESDVEALRLAIEEIRDAVWQGQGLPDVRRRVAKVLLAVHKRGPVLEALEGVRAAVWEPKTTLPNVKRRVARVLQAVKERES